MSKINIPISHKYQSNAYDKRVKFLIIHYTEVNFAESIKLLTKDVSVHYLVPDPNDLTYTDHKLNIYNLVNEQDRAWHAGISSWGTRSNLNDQSIGIEIVNCTSYEQTRGFNIHPYNDVQINAVIQLCKDILARYPDITPNHILGHSDIAPGRKMDPGPHFPWLHLYEQGIGAWYDDNAKQEYIKEYATHSMPDLTEIQNKLYTYGYNVKLTGEYDQQTRNCIIALQMHFRPSKYDGELDIETVAILSALVDKYMRT